ncbi:MAG: response regulator transcription factor [Patescibacteria group bacterium]|nr:response regulator transcription factor [Patescibacteria group bacterium]
MLRLYTNNPNTKRHWQSLEQKIVINDNTISSSPTYLAEQVSKQYQHNDIIILDLTLFEDSISKKLNIDDILELLSIIPTNIKIISIVEKPKIAEGAFLIKKGCKSYLQNLVHPKLLEQVIKTVKENNVWLYPDIMNYFIKLLQSDSSNINTKALNKLSAKEQQIALLVTEGKSNKDIANKLDIALVTVKKHMSSIFLKLDIRDRVSLTILLNKKDNI